ncbi:MAG: hypothetical protein ABEJ72_08135, partial [Candidatus Aenigmatarchaeota archaeon]
MSYRTKLRELIGGSDSDESDEYETVDEVLPEQEPEEYQQGEEDASAEREEEEDRQPDYGEALEQLDQTEYGKHSLSPFEWLNLPIGKEKKESSLRGSEVEYEFGPGDATDVTEVS